MPVGVLIPYILPSGLKAYCSCLLTNFWYTALAVGLTTSLAKDFTMTPWHATLDPQPESVVTISVGYTTNGMVMTLFEGNKQLDWRKCNSTCLEHAEAEAEFAYACTGAVAINGCPILQERNLNEELTY